MSDPEGKTIKTMSTTSLCLPNLRNCFRCGQEFRVMAQERICPKCHRPAEQKVLEGMCLSFRERQVVELIQQAKLNKEIAFELHLSEGTIKEYLNRIFRKLGVSNRTELALWAFRRRSSPENTQYYSGLPKEVFPSDKILTIRKFPNSINH